MSDLFSIRDATQDELEIVNAYAYAEGMDDLPSAEGVRVAESAAGDVVGFCRSFKGADGVDYIRPMVTYPTWRGYGVGRALVDDALERSCGELRLISRGGSVGFYRACGFEDASWDALDPEVAADCSGCPMRDECNPLPMTRLS
ncbi:MAG: GNAT family N-acetyltransferase [Eggerthellaceae bacterium]|nr:GNAT family N-acetyltransferase [Eggerthellaceae bacterium]